MGKSRSKDQKNGFRPKKTGTIPSQSNAGSPTPDSGNSVVEANNRFAFNLNSQMAKDPKFAGDNILISPFSIFSACQE